MRDCVSRFRVAVTPYHPRGRKWMKFLSTLDLDPDDLPRPVPAPGPKDFIICGTPRSGTTLLAAMLFQPPHTVTVMEPWSGMRLPPRELFSTIRKEIDETGRLSQGKLDISELLRSGKIQWVREGLVSHKVTTDPDYLLGIKWPAFWRYIELLPDTKFLVCLRDPKEVIASFKGTGGRLALGLGYDLAFDRKINNELRQATRNLALRRVLLYEKVNRHILPHLKRQNVMVVRYERWFEDPDLLMFDIGSFLDTPLGRGPASIRSPKPRRGLNRGEIRLMSEHSEVMRQLGYFI